MFMQRPRNPSYQTDQAHRDETEEVKTYKNCFSKQAWCWMQKVRGRKSPFCKRLASQS